MPCAKALGQLGAPSVGLRSCVAGALGFTSPRPQRFPASGTQSSSQNPSPSGASYCNRNTGGGGKSIKTECRAAYDRKKMYQKELRTALRKTTMFTERTMQMAVGHVCAPREG